MDYSLQKALMGSWDSSVHTLLVGSLSYLGTIVWLRLSGKRTLSKWNSFDFIVTIALGSILASALLNKTTSLFQAMAAVALLVSLQFVITYLSVRTGLVQSLIKSQPTLLLFKGKMLETALKKERVAEGEVLAAIRANGVARVEAVDAVVLETDGSFSVVETIDIDQASALSDVRGFKAQVFSTL